MKTIFPKWITSVSILYIGAAAFLDAQEPYINDPATELLYHLNEKSGTVATDFSGKSRHGTFGSGLSINLSSLPFFQKAVKPSASLTSRMHWTDVGAGINSFLVPKPNADFTIEGWFKLDSTSISNNRTLMAVQPTGLATSDYQLVIMASGDPTRPRGLVFRDGSAFRCYTGALTWDTSVWYHIAVIVDNTPTGTNYSIYRTPEGSPTPVLVATRSTTALIPTTSSSDRVFSVGNYYGNWGSDFFPGLIDEVRYSNVARSQDDLLTTIHPSVYDRIRREALSADIPNEHSLPLLSGWSTGIYAYIYNRPDDYGYSPKWQLTQIAAGRHLLPWFATPDPEKTPASTDWSKYIRYYENPLKEVAQKRLPVSFVSSQWEQYLYSGTYANKTEPLENPTVPFLDSKGKPQRGISAFGPIVYWTEIGEKWGSSSLMQTVQGWLPNPSLVLFVSNNEAPRLSYTYLPNDVHYQAIHGSGTRTPDFYREVVGNAWVDRYRELMTSWRGKLTTSWAGISKFVGYGAVGPSLLGRIPSWQKATLTIPNRLSPWPLAWDGGSADNYLTASYTYNNDHQVFSPQIEAMNYELSRREAVTQNPHFWFEVSTWNGGDYSAPWTLNEDDISKNKLCRFNPTANPTPTPGQPDTLVQPVPNPYVPTRYGGMVQFTMWLLRPKVVRDYRVWMTARADYDNILPYTGSSQPYFDELADAVDKIYTNETLQTFWRDSELVVNPSRVHPYQSDIPPEFNETNHPQTAARMYLLKTNIEPVGNWSLTTQLRAFVLGRVRGTAPAREWLLYGFAPVELPIGSPKTVQVTLPGFGNVTIDAGLEGRFYLVKEATGQVTPVN